MLTEAGAATLAARALAPLPELRAALLDAAQARRAIAVAASHPDDEVRFVIVSQAACGHISVTVVDSDVEATSWTAGHAVGSRPCRGCVPREASH